MYLGRINFKGVQLTLRLLRYGHCLCCGLCLVAHPIVWLYDPSILCILHILNIHLHYNQKLCRSRDASMGLMTLLSRLASNIHILFFITPLAQYAGVMAHVGHCRGRAAQQSFLGVCGIICWQT